MVNGSGLRASGLRSAIAAGLLFMAASHSRDAHAAEPEFALSEAFMDEVGVAWGYCVSQGFSLRWIAERWPSLASAAELAGLRFDRRYRGACDKIERFMGEVIPAEKLGGWRADVLKKALPTDPSGLAIEDGVAFIAEVDRRSEGEVPSPAYEILHVFGWRSAPALEMSQGHIQRYRTEGEPKALGLRMSIDAPVSWKGKPGRQPHMLRQWTYQNGHGSAAINIQVRPFEFGEISESEISEYVASGGAANEMEDGAELISALPISLGPAKGYRKHFSRKFERLGARVQTEVIADSLFFDGVLVVVSCFVLDVGKGVVPFALIEPLCQLVSNSIVFENAWR